MTVGFYRHLNLGGVGAVFSAAGVESQELKTQHDAHLGASKMNGKLEKVDYRAVQQSNSLSRLSAGNVLRSSGEYDFDYCIS